MNETAPMSRVFPRRLTHGGGGFLTIGYCFPYCFLEIFVGGKALMEGGKVLMGAILSPPTRENPDERSASLPEIC